MKYECEGFRASMNHGFVLNDGASKIRSSYFPMPSVIVRDDPHCSREEVYTGNGARVSDGRRSGGGSRGGGHGRVRPLTSSSATPSLSFPSESGLHLLATPAGRSSQKHDDDMLSDQAGQPGGGGTVQRRRTARTTSGLPSYMAPTTSSERKHLPEGEDGEHDHGLYADEDFNGEGISHSESDPQQHQQQRTRHRHVVEEPHVPRATLAPHRREPQRTPLGSRPLHPEYHAGGGGVAAGGSTSPQPRSRTQSNAAARSSASSPPPPARFRTTGPQQHIVDAQHRGGGASRQPIRISPLNSFARVTALSLDDSDDVAVCEYDNEDPADVVVAAAYRSGHRGSAGGRHEDPALHCVSVSAESSITCSNDDCAASTTEEDRHHHHQHAGSSACTQQYRILAEEASWREFMIDDECEAWGELVDAAMDGVAEIILHRGDIMPPASTSPTTISRQSLSPMSNSPAAQIEPSNFAVPGPATEDVGSASDAAHIEVIGSEDHYHALEEGVDSLHPASSASAASQQQQQAPPPRGNAEQRTLAITTLATAVAPPVESEAPPIESPLDGVQLDSCPAVASLVDDHTRSTLLPPPPPALPSMSELPPELQQYLQVLHYQTVMLSDEMRRVTQSHSTLSIDLVNAQREIEAMRRQRDAQQLLHCHVEGTNVAIATGEDSISAATAVGVPPSAPAIAETPADDPEVVPVHPVFEVSGGHAASSMPPLAQHAATVEEGLEVEGAGNIARSVYLLLSYPLQCCMRRPT
jgi:hypothetical protein